jgi:hypothetical protein
MGHLGAWRSLVARTVRVGEVPGSNPGAPMLTMEHDERAAEPPANEPPEQEAGDEEGAGGGEVPGESPGPRGNPQVDEESLSHKQQEQAPPDDD